MTLSEQELRILASIADSLATIAKAVKDGVIQTEDVARAKVYSEHLGEKLRKDG